MVKIKIVTPSSSYPTMSSGVWRRSPAEYGIFRDGTQVGMIINSGPWHICDNNRRPHLQGRYFMSFKAAKKWAVENMDDPRTYGGVKALSEMLMAAFK